MTSRIQAPRCSVLLPAYNEEAIIAQTINDVRRYGDGCDILVIDSYSRDRTADVAVNMGTTVISIVGRGKARAVRGALERLLLDGTPYYIMMDSDYTYPGKYIPRIINELDKGADVVMAYRNRRAPKSMSLVNLVGNKALSLLASMLYGFNVKDVCTGMWGFRIDALRKFALTSIGFTLEADLFANSMLNGCCVTQIPISYRARADGSLSKLKVSDGFKIGWFLIKKRFGRA